MKTIILTCKNNLTMNNLYFFSWMQKRAEMYSAIAESDFLNLKKVDFCFADPEAGWVDMTVRFDGKTVAELSLSGVWGSDPVADLLIWTEKSHCSYMIVTTKNLFTHYAIQKNSGKTFTKLFAILPKGRKTMIGQ